MLAKYRMFMGKLPKEFLLRTRVGALSPRFLRPSLAPLLAKSKNIEPSIHSTILKIDQSRPTISVDEIQLLTFPILSLPCQPLNGHQLVDCENTLVWTLSSILLFLWLTMTKSPRMKVEKRLDLPLDQDLHRLRTFLVGPH